MSEKYSEKYTEHKMRQRFRIEAMGKPEVLVNQFVNFTLSGPSYKVLEVVHSPILPNSDLYYWFAKLQGYQAGCTLNGNYLKGYVAVSRINYYSADLLALYKQRIATIERNMKD